MNASPPRSRPRRPTQALADLPLYAGFGISTPEQAADAAALADGIVVGSRAVEVAEEGPDALHHYVETLRAAIGAAAIIPSR